MHLLPLLLAVLPAGPQDAPASTHSALPSSRAIRVPGGEAFYELTPIGLAIGEGIHLGRHGALLPVSELQEGRGDLNGDGDRSDFVAHYYDVDAGTTFNLGLAVARTGTSIRPRVRVLGPRFFMLVTEADQKEDLNGDGDLLDDVAFVFDSEEGSITNLGWAVSYVNLMVDAQWSNVFTFRVLEEASGSSDLNGDGDAEDGIVFVYDAVSGRLENTGMDTWVVALDGGRTVQTIRERDLGGDGNGDGDTDDYVWHLYDVRDGRLTNLELAAPVESRLLGASLQGRFSIFLVGEEADGQRDLNGDGDADDEVVFLHDTVTGITRNLEWAVDPPFATMLQLEQGYASFPVWESAQGDTDLTGDGDTEDMVMFVHDISTGEETNLGLAGWGGGARRGTVVGTPVWEQLQGETDLNHDGDTWDRVYAVHDLRRGFTVNTGLAVQGHQLDREKILLYVNEVDQQMDLNGDGDTEDEDVLHVIDVRRRTLTNLRRALPRNYYGYLLSGHHEASPLVGFTVNEFADGRDHDGDGELTRDVMHVYHMELGGPFSLGVPGHFEETPLVCGEQMLFRSLERPGEDWNGDGDSNDQVAMVLRRVGR